jgi:hypothetical protein
MTSEGLVAAAKWLDEIEAQLAAAAGQKWAALGEEFDQSDDGEAVAYQTRAAELDEALVRPLRDRRLKACRLLESRAAEMVVARASWPAGGSWVARAYALAQSLESVADPVAVQAELAVLRQG